VAWNFPLACLAVTVRVLASICSMAIVATANSIFLERKLLAEAKPVELPSLKNPIRGWRTKGRRKSARKCARVDSPSPMASCIGPVELENVSGRDKIWFHPTLNLRRDTTSDQLQQALASFREILTRHAKVETGKMPVRFIGVGPYSLDVEADAYVTTADYDEFMALRQELLIGNAESSRTCRYRTCCTDAGELRSQQCSADVAVRCALQPKNPRSGVGNFARLGNTVGMSALVTPNHRASVAPY
jgi:hypothetical protein